MSEPRQLRRKSRLSDDILKAFHHACDVEELDVADRLLRIMEKVIARLPVAQNGEASLGTQTLSAAHERLWNLRNRSAEEPKAQISITTSTPWPPWLV